MEHIKHAVGCLLIAGLAVPAEPARSAEPDDPAERLDAIVVSASRAGPRDSERLPLSVTIIDRQAIESSPGRTLDELLRTVVGIQLPDLNSTIGFPANPSVSMRGLGLGDNGTRTLVLLDGVPMNGAYFGNVFWNRVPKHNIERIEIIRGASSSVFGAYAMGGTINIVTRRIDDQARFELTGRGGTDATYEAGAFAAGSLADGLRAGLSVDRFDTDGYIPVVREQRGAIDRKAGSALSSASIRLEYEASPEVLLYARGNYLNQNRDGATELSVSHTRTADLTIGLDAALADDQRLQASVFLLDEQFDTDNTSLSVFGSRDAEFVSNRHATPAEDLGASLVWSGWLSAAVPSVAVGIDFRRIEGEDQQTIFRADGSRFLDQDARGQQRSLGIFGELSYRPIEAIELLATVRYDDYRISAGRIVTDGVETRFEDNDFDRFNPRLAARYQLADGVAIRSAWYRGFRAPTLAELYRRFGTSTFVGLPNPQLEPETLSGGEIGLDLRVGPLTSQINLFRNDIDNLVGGVVVAFRPFTLLNANIGEVRSRGIELINSLAIDSHWQFDFGYIYTDAEIIDNLDDPSLIGNRNEGVPRHFGSAALSWRDANWDVTVRGRHLGTRFQDASNETRLSSHTVIDASVAYQVNDRLRLHVAAENLFDNDYVANALGGVGQLGAPLQVLLGATWTY